MEPVILAVGLYKNSFLPKQLNKAFEAKGKVQ